MPHALRCALIGISIHALLAESDHPVSIFVRVVKISIHALLAESDRVKSGQQRSPRNFYPRSPCGERLCVVRGTSSGGAISIHALLAESDISARREASEPIDFYPRSPCGERRLLTLQASPQIYFYPRSPCGERPAFWFFVALKAPISIHALLAESDLAGPSGPAFLFNFYPRSPCGERRWLRCWQLAARDISIHALLAESDNDAKHQTCHLNEFLSTLSLRRATGAISQLQCVLGNFYPRSPCGERRA